MKKIFFSLFLILVTAVYSLSQSSALAVKAAAMTPGSWDTLTTNGFSYDMFFGSGIANDGGFTFAMNGVWNSTNHLGYFWSGVHSNTNPGPCFGTVNQALCADETQRFIKYTDSTNTYSEVTDSIGKLNDQQVPSNGGHIYNHFALDPSTGNVYKLTYAIGTLKEYNPNTNTWTAKTSLQSYIDSLVGGSGNPISISAMAWYPEANGLVILTDFGGTKYTIFWDKATNVYHTISTSLVFGAYNEVAVYNSVLHNMFMGSGFDPITAANQYSFYILTYATGCGSAITPACWSATAKRTLPNLFNTCSIVRFELDASSQVANIVLDPVSGNYIIVTHDAACNLVMYSYESQNDVWTQKTGGNVPPAGLRLGNATVSGYIESVPVPEYGVILYIEQESTVSPFGIMRIYKPDSTAPVLTFSAKCALPGVLHCDGFDDVSTVTYNWPDPALDSTKYYVGQACNNILGPSGLNKTNIGNLNPYLGTAAAASADYTAGQCVYPQIITSNKHSGTGSLKFSVPNHAATVSGEYYGVFKDHGSGHFGYVGPVPTTLVNANAVNEGNDLWIQFYSYIDSTMLNTAWGYAYQGYWATASAGATVITPVSATGTTICSPNTGYLTAQAGTVSLANFNGQKIMFQWGTNFTTLTSFTITSHTADDCGLNVTASPTPSMAGNVANQPGYGQITTNSTANGWKQIGVYGDPGPGQFTCCGPAAQAVNDVNQTGVPSPYSYAGGGVVTYADTNYEIGCPWVTWPDPMGVIYTAPPCVRYKPNQWQEITIHMNMAAGTYNDTVCPSTTTGLYQLWVDGVLAVQRNDFRLCWGAVTISSSGANGLGQFNLSPYHTHSDPNLSHADTYVLYDDLIISTQPIPRINTSSPAPPPTTRHKKLYFIRKIFH